MYETRKYRQAATLIRAIDADTIVVRALNAVNPLRQWSECVVRLAGVNCPELRAVGGPEAVAWVRAWLPPGEDALLLGHDARRDPFGRLVGRIARGTEDLSDTLIATEHGVPYLTTRLLGPG